MRTARLCMWRKARKLNRAKRYARWVQQARFGDAPASTCILRFMKTGWKRIRAGFFNTPSAERGVFGCWRWRNRRKIIWMVKIFFRILFKIIRAPFIFLIWLYQKTLSPDHGILRVLFPGGFCKYTPSCSEYTLQAIQKRGLIIGGALGLWRILRCNPCSRGGIDLP